MKGMLELHFPSLATGRAGQVSTAESSAKNMADGNRGGWLHASSPLKVLPKLQRSRGIPVGDYLELLRKEYLLKRLSPQWSSFHASRLSLRLHGDWIEHVAHARSLARSLYESCEPTGNGEEARVPLCEVIIPARRVSLIHRRSDILDAPLVTITDLGSDTPCKDWSLAESYASLAKEHAALGLEFFCKPFSRERELLRCQLRVASLLKPKFIRLVQTSDVRKSLFQDSSQMDQDQMKDLSVALEAFSALNFEPIAVYPHAIILSSDPNLDWKQLGIPRRILGLGVGAKSRRLDGAGRAISSYNASTGSEYRKSVHRMWQNREAVQKAHSIPYLHSAIERSLSGDSGLCYESIRERFGFDLEKAHPGLSSVLKEAGLVEQSANRLVLTQKGKADPHQVARNFFLREKDLRIR